MRSGAAGVETADAASPSFVSRIPPGRNVLRLEPEFAIVRACDGILRGYSGWVNF
jgi:hypothetical protein